MKRLQVKTLESPLTLALSPKGRGDKASPLTLALSPKGRGDKAGPLTLALSPKGRGDKASPLTLALSPKGRGDNGKMPPRRKRAGLLMVEMIVSLILLGTVVSIVIPTLGWMGRQNRLSLQKQEAIQGLHNLMEDLTARPSAELTPRAAEKIELPAALRRQLPGAKLQVEITEAPPNAKRIRLRLAWIGQNGRPLAPLRLSAWVYDREGKR